MPSDATDLARFQAALLELLAEVGMNANRARQRLANDPAFAPYRVYVESFQPRMLETAILLTRRWGERGP